MRSHLTRDGHLNARSLVAAVTFLLLTLYAHATSTANTPLPDLKRNTIHDLTATNGLTYHLRLPAGYNAKTPSPALLILHGSNMNAKAYVATVAGAWPKLAADYVLIGIDGENRVAGSPDNNPAFNYTYINFVGKGSTFKGYPGSEKESPALVTDALQEIKKQLPLGKVFVGGHSQGGWLTLSCYMYFPELFAGAFPVSGGLIVQCEPTAFKDEKARAAQRKGAIAVVYGERDKEWAAAGAASYESFADDAFPRLRRFALPQGDHRFGLLPVEQAVRWLEAVTSDDPKALVAFAERQLKTQQFRDAHAAATRARELDESKALAARIDAVLRAVETPAKAAAAKLEPAIKSAKDDSWVPQFTRFRQDFEFTEAASAVMQAYRDLREQHEKPARELWNAARKDFSEKNPDEGYKKYQQIVSKYFASSWYRYAKSALDSRPRPK
jgi:pimeloyl-ACP methyl ester carboxylesterase